MIDGQHIVTGAISLFVIIALALFAIGSLTRELRIFCRRLSERNQIYSRFSEVLEKMSVTEENPKEIWDELVEIGVLIDLYQDAYYPRRDMLPGLLKMKCLCNIANFQELDLREQGFRTWIYTMEQ